MLLSLLVNTTSVSKYCFTPRILTKNHVSFRVHFSSDKYYFCLDTYWTQLILSKINVSFIVQFLVNRACLKTFWLHLGFWPELLSISVLLKRLLMYEYLLNALCILKKKSFIVPFYLSKYSFSFDTLWIYLVFHLLFICVLVNITLVLLDLLITPRTEKAREYTGWCVMMRKVIIMMLIERINGITKISEWGKIYKKRRK